MTFAAKGFPAAGSVLQHWDSLEPWQRDNEYILDYYRARSDDHWKSISSLCYLHNQTVNIYSHLLGALGFGAVAVSLYAHTPSTARYDAEDRALLALFFVGAIVCFGSSAYYHLVGNHSHQVYNAWLTMDFLGIIFLITGTALPLATFTYPCHSRILQCCGSSTIVTAITCTVLCLAPEFRQSHWRRYRAVVFTLFALIGFFPLFHSILLFGYRQAEQQIGWSWFASGGLLYISGAMVYAARFPERYLPGAFDIWGSSHQIFHILVVCGAVLHLNGILTSLSYHYDSMSGVKKICQP